MYTMDHTFGYRSKKLICACVKSSAHAHDTEIRGQKFETFENNHRTSKVMDSSPLIHKGAYGHQAVIQGQGGFTKHGLPPGDTSCNVNGVYIVNL